MNDFLPENEDILNLDSNRGNWDQNRTNCGLNSDKDRGAVPDP
jgi:hypothetical protein